MSSLDNQLRSRTTGRTIRWCLTSATLCLTAFAVGCGAADNAVTTGPPATIPEWVGVVSNATRAIPDPAGSVAFVSLPRGTLGIGLHATITNVRTKAQVTATVANGGFDPVRVAASTGDALRIQVDELGRGSRSSLYTAVVPAARRPVVVHTEPVPGTLGISTQTVFLVVFSEPMRLNDAVRLRRGNVPVPGNATLFGPDQLHLLFTPNARLDAGTMYDFEIGPQAVDLDGESLETPFQLALSTKEQAPPPILTATFSVVEYPDGVAWSYAPQLVVTLDGTGGDAVFDRAVIVIPGVGSFGACWQDGRLAQGSTTEMFGEVYGDWWYVLTSSTPATGPIATATINYTDVNGQHWSVVLHGRIVPGGPPNYGAGGAHPWFC